MDLIASRIIHRHCINHQQSHINQNRDTTLHCFKCLTNYHFFGRKKSESGVSVFYTMHLKYILCYIYILFTFYYKMVTMILSWYTLEQNAINLWPNFLANIKEWLLLFLLLLLSLKGNSSVKKFLTPKVHQNPICVSKVTAILLKGWILYIGGALAGEGLQSTGLPVWFIKCLPTIFSTENISCFWTVVSCLHQLLSGAFWGLLQKYV